MNDTLGTFDPAGYFDRALAWRYDQGIRLSCPGYDALHSMLVPLLRLLPQETRFLSAGCGTGGEIRALARRFAHWHFTGVDVSPDMLEVCRREAATAGIAARVTLLNARIEMMKAWLLYYVADGANADKLATDLRHIFANMAFTPEPELREQLREAGFTGVARFFQSYLFGGWVATKAA